MDSHTVSSQRPLRATDAFAWRYKREIIILLLGISALILGNISKAFLSDPWPIVIVELGIAAIIVAIAETFLLTNAMSNMKRFIKSSETELKDFVLSSTQTLQAETKAVFPIITQASNNGIEAIMDPRYIEKGDTRQPTPTIDALKTYMYDYITNPNVDNKFVKISAISCRDFFALGSEFSVILGAVTSGRTHLPTNISLQALIMNKYGAAAKARAAVEQGQPASQVHFQFEKSAIYKDLNSSYSGVLETLKSLSADPIQNLSLEVKLFDFLPSAFFILTTDALFIEQYHVGRRDNLGVYKCVGGLVPILRYRNNSPMYSFISRQFDLIWGSDQTGLFSVVPFTEAAVFTEDSKTYHSGTGECSQLKQAQAWDLLRVCTEADAITRQLIPCQTCVGQSRTIE